MKKKDQENSQLVIPLGTYFLYECKIVGSFQFNKTFHNQQCQQINDLQTQFSLSTKTYQVYEPSGLQDFPKGITICTTISKQFSFVFLILILFNSQIFLFSSSLLNLQSMCTNGMFNLPWWSVLMASSLCIRLFIFPLILVQMKKMSQLGPIWPVFATIKETWRHSEMNKWEKIKICRQLYLLVAKSQNFRMKTIFVYNLAYYPLLIIMIYAIRGLLSIPEVASSGFFYIQNLADIDPFYILPTITIAAYYWNFQRFITPENKHTLISKIRSICQVFLIIWFPFLCCWPSGIVLYMCCNACISIAQSTLMKSIWFQTFINPKIVHYNRMLAKAEIDKGTSQSVVSAILSGDQSWKEREIKETVLMKQIGETLQKINQEAKITDQDRTAIREEHQSEEREKRKQRE